LQKAKRALGYWFSKICKKVRLGRRRKVFFAIMKKHKRVGADSQSGHNQAQQNTTVDVPIGVGNGIAGLSDAERSSLRSENISDEYIEILDAVRRYRNEQMEKSGPKLPRLIADYAETMVKDAGGKPLFTATMMGIWLVSHGLYKPSGNKPSHYFVGLGDAAGKRGLALPSLYYMRKHYYDLSYVEMSEEEKSVRVVQLKKMKLEELKTLFGDIA
jgi:hypothetical protein